MPNTSVNSVSISLLDTLGEVDHRKVRAPYVRLVSITNGTDAHNQAFVYDLRFAQPNKDHIPMASVHSLEHLMAVLIAKYLPTFVNLGPMGCQTGFYLTLMNQGSYSTVSEALKLTLQDILKAEEVPLCNEEQCGWAANHDLLGAQKMAAAMLEKYSEWSQVY